MDAIPSANGPELVAIVARLRSPSAAVLPAHLGRANQAQWLAHVGRFNADLAATLHDGSSPRPHTVSGLLEASAHDGNITVAAGGTYHIRLTGLTSATCHALQHIANGVVAQDAAHLVWPLHGHPFQWLASLCDASHHPLSGHAHYAAVVKRWRTAGALPTTIRLRFASPTFFQLATKRQMPLPLPELVFGSLMDAWTRFSTEPLPFGADEVRRRARDSVGISRFRLESVPVPWQRGITLRGAVGQVEYTLFDADPLWLLVLHVLADFAFYSGVGAKTSAGLGQCHRLP